MAFFRISVGAVMLVLALFSAGVLNAQSFTLPNNQGSLLGAVSYIRTVRGDTPASISQRYNIGINALLAANPGTTDRTHFSGGTTIQLPAAFLLPPLPHRGIVINLPEMRLYYYLPDGGRLMTFPIGIGRPGKTIPIIRTAITRKVKNPVWVPPADIREYNEDKGISLPARMPAGPDNPLGPWAIYLRVPTYLIHSTIFPESIGQRASFGCIRMNEDDISRFYPLVTAGTPVEIVDMPNKAGWSGNTLFLEAHPPLEEHRDADYATLDGIVRQIEGQMSKSASAVTLVNWQLVASIASQPDGIPHAIGLRLQ